MARKTSTYQRQMQHTSNASAGQIKREFQTEQIAKTGPVYASFKNSRRVNNLHINYTIKDLSFYLTKVSIFVRVKKESKKY